MMHSLDDFFDWRLSLINEADDGLMEELHGFIECIELAGVVCFARDNGGAGTWKKLAAANVDFLRWYHRNEEMPSGPLKEMRTRWLAYFRPYLQFEAWKQLNRWDKEASLSKIEFRKLLIEQCLAGKKVKRLAGSMIQAEHSAESAQITCAYDLGARSGVHENIHIDVNGKPFVLTADCLRMMGLSGTIFRQVRRDESDRLVELVVSHQMKLVKFFI